MAAERLATFAPGVVEAVVAYVLRRELVGEWPRPFASAGVGRRVVLLLDLGVRLDLDQIFVAHERRGNQRVGRFDHSETRAVRTRDGLPVGNVPDIYTGSNDVNQARTQRLQSAFDLVDDEMRLGGRVVPANHTIAERRGRARYVDVSSLANRSCKAGDAFPCRPARHNVRPALPDTVS
jgi:hypothetical protein